MSDAIQLKPCPFCGSAADHYPDGEEEGFVILCSGSVKTEVPCPLGAFAFKTQAESVAAWNQRAALAAYEQRAASPEEWVDANVSGNPALMQAMKNHAAASPEHSAVPMPVTWGVFQDGGLMHTGPEASCRAYAMGDEQVLPLYVAPPKNQP